MKKLGLLFLIPVAALISIYFISCSANFAINDLYGIQMAEVDTAEFKIISYNEEEGVSFDNSPLMEPRIFAWGEFDNETLTLIITNNSPKAIPSGFASDSFYLIDKDGKEYGLIKAFPHKYPTYGTLMPNQTIQLTLDIPREYNEALEHRSLKVSSDDTDVVMVQSYEKGINYNTLNKEKTKLVKIILGGRMLIILKPVPSD